MAFDQMHQAGNTSQMIEVSLRSNSTGQLLTGIAFGGVTAKYVREGAASTVTVSVVTMTQGTFVSGGWVETGIAGVYQFGIPDAALATGAKAVTLVFSAPGALDVVKRVVLVSEDLRDALISSRLAPTTPGRTLAVDAAGGVALAASQGGVTFSGQVTITTSKSGEGALHIVNSHASGYGQYIQSNSIAQYIQGNTVGQYIYGTSTGQSISGSTGRNITGYATTLRSALGMAAANMDSQLAAILAGGLTAQQVRDAMMLAASAGTPAAESVDAKLDSILEDTGTDIPAAIADIDCGGAGSGTGHYTDTVLDGVTPLDGVRVQLSTDSAGSNRVYEAYTNALGVFEMWPDPGTYYAWFDLAGYTFTQGVEVVVT